MDKVSIIVPVYNAAERLPKCIDSILRQDYPDLELILVDDGSSDGSLPVMEDYARRDSRVVVIHKDNGGVSSTRNRGLDAATGRYVQFVDADDWLPMDSTKLLVRQMTGDPVDLVIGEFYRVVDDNVSRRGSIEKSCVLTVQSFADKMATSPADLYYGALWNKLYRMDIIRSHNIRMDENISLSEDMVFNLEYLIHTRAISVITAPVYYYRYSRGSLTEQGLSFRNVVRMKSNVIRYYTNFYRKTFDRTEYQDRLPVIYSYLLSVSTDNVVLPFGFDSKRLGTEAGNPLILLSKKLSGSPLQSIYLRNRLLARYMDTLAKKHGLDVEDMTVLYFLKRLAEPCGVREIALFTEMSRLTVLSSVTRLKSRGLVTSNDSKDDYSYCAGDPDADLENVERDFAAVCYEGLSDEDLAVYRRCEDTICENIRGRMSPDERL